MEEKDQVAIWMMSNGYATGHGDTIADMLGEMEAQIIKHERKRCAGIVQLAREDKVDTDFRSIKAIILCGDTIEKIKRYTDNNE